MKTSNKSPKKTPAACSPLRRRMIEDIVELIVEGGLVAREGFQGIGRENDAFGARR